MATVQANSYWVGRGSNLPQPANTDEPFPSSSSDHKLIAWLFRITARHGSTPTSAAIRTSPLQAEAKLAPEKINETPDDWQTVASLCGHDVADFTNAEIGLPLSTAEIDHFRRNHRGIDNMVSRDFMNARSDLPSPLSELYGLYRHRARLDAEAALFVAQATGSTRIARIMSDLLAIGGFASGHECIAHMTMTYSVPAAFDTSDLIDRANQEAARRLALPIDHPAHLLKLSPDEISVLASNIVERNLMSGPDFLEKANLLAEARQDVNRLVIEKQFVTAIGDHDLPVQQSWVARICAAYARVFENWVADLPEIKAIISHRENMI